MTLPLPPALAAWRAALGAELIETHISWLLLDRDYVYKIKKPLQLPFLDYGSEARRRFCDDEELRLNRRYAPGLYLGLVSVPDSREFAVKMRRFDEAGRLDHVCARGELMPAELGDLSRVIAAFHRDAAVADASSRFGELASIIDPARENFVALRGQLSDEADALREVEALATWTEEEFSRRREQFVARKAQGRVRECHGDLHLGNLVRIDGHIVPFDCIDFNEDFRWIDVASEIAFTYIDLIDHDQPGLALWLLNEWLAETGDFGALAVLRFYAVYRALVRAKVAGLRGERGALLDYLRLARRLASPPPPTMAITFGLSGSGKSRAGRQRLLADRAAATVRLRSDVERKRLFGLSAGQSSHSQLGGGIYTADASQATRAHLLDLARGIVGEGWSVLVDATFLRRAEREQFRQIAQTLGVPFTILAREAPVDTLRARILRRQARGKDASEATLAVLEQQLRILEPLGDDERAWTTVAVQD